MIHTYVLSFFLLLSTSFATVSFAQAGDADAMRAIGQARAAEYRKSAIGLRKRLGAAKFDLLMSISAEDLEAALSARVTQRYAGATILTDTKPPVNLGSLVGKFEQTSIFNVHGEYGSKHRANSIFNRFGQHGSEFQLNTAFNANALKPPVIAIITDGQLRLLGRLSVNPSIKDRIDPFTLLQYFNKR